MDRRHDRLRCLVVRGRFRGGHLDLAIGRERWLIASQRQLSVADLAVGAGAGVDQAVFERDAGRYLGLQRQGERSRVADGPRRTKSSALLAGSRRSCRRGRRATRRSSRDDAVANAVDFDSTAFGRHGAGTLRRVLDLNTVARYRLDGERLDGPTLRTDRLGEATRTGLGASLGVRPGVGAGVGPADGVADTSTDGSAEAPGDTSDTLAADDAAADGSAADAAGAVGEPAAGETTACEQPAPARTTVNSAIPATAVLRIEPFPSR